MRRAGSSSPRSAARPRRYEGNGQCLIKGNHSRRGDWIYHLPGMPYYDATRVGIYGTSAGGQNSTGALLFHGDFYKAAMDSDRRAAVGWEAVGVRG